MIYRGRWPYIAGNVPKIADYGCVYSTFDNSTFYRYSGSVQVSL